MGRKFRFGLWEGPDMEFIILVGIVIVLDICIHLLIGNVNDRMK